MEISYCVTRRAGTEAAKAGRLASIRGHWAAIAAGTHYRRDVTVAEDAWQTAHRVGAEVLATRRRLANGRFELACERQRALADTRNSWGQRPTCSPAWPLLRR